MEVFGRSDGWTFPRADNGRMPKDCDITCNGRPLVKGPEGNVAKH